MLPMQNRERLEIARDILNVAMQEREGVTKSKIMFHVDLSSNQARAYLGDLIDQSFIEHNEIRHVYHTTPRGIQYLGAINTIMEMIEKRVGSENPPARPEKVAMLNK